MTINCNGKLISLQSPKVMGVININEDSFYAQSRATTLHDIEAKAMTMIKHGAAIIDIGAMSSKPGSPILAQDHEWNILKPVIGMLAKLDTIISIDTVWSSTAHNAIYDGAHIINDISGGNFDKAMLPTIPKIGSVPFIMMHMKGTPEFMQQNTDYKDLMLDMLGYFSHNIRLAKDHGIKDIVIDPGFGFSKTLDQNYKILSQLSAFQIFDLPILAGLSRKSMLYRLLETTPELALNATTSANTIALMHGASILRVHDVKEAVEAIKIYNKVFNQ